jgi:hypothetical protein
VVHAGHAPALLDQAVELLEAMGAGDGHSVESARTFALAVGQGLEPTNRLVAAVLAGGATEHVGHADTRGRAVHAAGRRAFHR